ncbi:MAG: cold shock domain-containing protein, partial [Gammaproteobacteria bacterium]|nr:cold shock domain-containing protein [Gammaproteobacteria bacterium]
LKAGQAVSFDMIDGPKGIHAVNVSPVESESDSEPDA